MKKVFIVPYCHSDWAWTFTRRWHEKRYVLIFEEVLDVLKRHSEFRWYMDTYITELEPFLRMKPERFEELKERVHEGKIGICGTFTNLRPNTVGEETFIRDIIKGRKKFGELFPGADLSVYAATVDISLGHPQFPQILQLAGYKYFRFWRPHAALSVKNVPLEFFWKGLDGSRILCSRGAYSGFRYCQNIFENFQKEVAYNQELSPTGIRWISQGMDDTRPLKTPYEDKPIPVFRFLREWKSKEKVSLGFATPLEFFQELEKHEGKIPEISGSLDPCETAFDVGWGGKSGIFYLRQENEINLSEAEKWSSIASLHGYSYPGEKLEKLWEKHLISCAHATQWLFEGDFKKILELTQYVKLESETIKNDSLDFLKNLISVRKNTELIIFNSLPSDREEKIPVDLSFPIGKVKEITLIDGKGEELPFQIRDINYKGGKAWEYLVTTKISLPPLGYNTISILQRKPKARARKYPFEVRLKGSEIVEIRAGEYTYKTTARNSFGNLKLYSVDTTKGVLHVGPITGEQKATWRRTKIKEDGQLYIRYSSLGSIGQHRIERDIIVYKDEPRIEFHTEIYWHREDGFLTLEFPKVFKGKIHGDIPFGVEEKDIDREPFGELPGQGWDNIERQRENLFFTKSFLNYTDGKRSISYFNYDATHRYLSLKNSIGNILMNSVTYKSGWERFINESIEGEGKHKFVSHLFFHSGNWRRANLPRKAQTLFIKPEKIFADDIARKKLPASYSFFSLSPVTLIMSAFYADRKDFVLRFYESTGRETQAEIKLSFFVERVRKTNLEGKTLMQLGHGKAFSFKVNPWEIVSLVFRVATQVAPSIRSGP